MKEGYRHGDLLLVKIASLPEGLKEAKTKVLMTGSGGNDHTFKNGKFYPKQVDRFIFGYLVAGEGCKLLHLGHGDKTLPKIKGLWQAPIDVGIYETKKQHEDTHKGMVEVID